MRYYVTLMQSYSKAIHLYNRERSEKSHRRKIGKYVWRRVSNEYEYGNDCKINDELMFANFADRGTSPETRFFSFGNPTMDDREFE